MVRTKTKKLRGGHYGRGMKSGRGKGKRGGSGMAGLGGHRKIWLILHDKEHFGVHGFTSHSMTYENPITLNQLNDRYEELKANGYVEKGIIDLESAGYTKLLGSGNFEVKCKIKIPKATEKTIKKLSNYGITIEND
ncbi:MAG: uL15 family ribosomal protein [Candidatus Thermoplasmatota archaeon]|uniref:uL15m family ribosomal protein n=1 Tax=Ferroplasma sp. TaxID=2591003 RepID=UPI002635E36C|nr:uL15m family ribosomal protein [Ferroplasma sp.]MCL4311708.1 uL15 family ribosomal protein [Candidatus Thermoplasmatota archaeon]